MPQRSPRVTTDAQKRAWSERLRRNREDPEIEARRVAALRSPGHRDFCRARIKRQRLRPNLTAPDVLERRAKKLSEQWQRGKMLAGVRRGVEKRWAKVRGGAIPEGYEALYQQLRNKNGAKEALRMVRLQRAADMRKAA